MLPLLPLLRTSVSQVMSLTIVTYISHVQLFGVTYCQLYIIYGS